VVGRTITKVVLNRFSDGRGGYTYNPVFSLDNGTQIAFVVDETESTVYGITPLLRRPL
jgi:hypothetical protein